MYSFGSHMRRDPFGPDPLGPNLDQMQNPDPYLNQFQFEQNPNSMTPPSMGIGLGGEVSQPSYMNDMSAGGGNPEYGSAGPNWAGGLATAGKLMSGLGQQERQPLPGVGKAAQGSAMEFIFPYAEQIAALQELKRGRRR